MANDTDKTKTQNNVAEKQPARQTTQATAAQDTPARVEPAQDTAAQAPAPRNERGQPVINIGDTPPVDELDSTSPVRLGAERATEITKEISETTGDPIRDAKLMEVHGSLYDPATSPDDLTRPGDTVKVDKVITPRTQAEMNAGRAALDKRNSGAFKATEKAPPRNQTVDRQNVTENFRTRTSGASSYPAGSKAR